MADVVLPVTELALNAVTTAPTGQAVTSADVAVLTHAATVAGHTAKDQVELRKVAIFLDPATTATVTVQAGDNPPANRSVVGDLTLSVAGDRWVVLEAANYVQSDGTVRLTTSANVTVHAIQLPDSL